VLYRAEVDVVWDFKDATQPAATMTAKGGPASHIDARQHRRLRAQEPKTDYLPGAPDDSLAEFGVVEDLFPKGSLTAAQWQDKATSDVEKFKDVIAVTRAEWFNQTTGSGPDPHAASDLKNLKPGLNYYSKLGVPGETGYIDSKGVYHNPDLPIEPKANDLPRVVVILGPAAFHRDKDWAVTTLRHELRHATHNQLAVRWMIKWRESGDKQTFAQWIDAQRKAKKISNEDAALATTGVKKKGPAGERFELTPTEVFGYAEGTIASLPFLPAKPVLAHMTNDRYPASIRSIKEGLPVFTDGGTHTSLAFDRIHDAACAVGQNAALVTWLDFLIKPDSVTTASKDDEKVIALVKKDFGSSTKVLGQMRTAAKKACK
jgi:hypothetical protein